MPLNANARQCKAKSLTTGQRCKNPAVTGMEVCRKHGGATPRGVASANFKHGRYSKDLPTRLAARYQEAMDDPDIGILRNEIALIDTRISEMLSKVDTEQYGNIWSKTNDAYNRLQSAMKRKDPQDTIAAMESLGTAIKQGYSDTSTWNNIVELIEQRRKLVDSERRRLVDLQQMITTERAMLLVSALVNIVKEHVSDKQQLAAISTDIGVLIAANNEITAR